MKKLSPRGVPTAVTLLLAISLGAHEIEAQTTFTACRVPDVGAIYMIGVEGAPSACLDETHIEFSWTEGGGTLSEGSVTTTEILDGTIETVDIAFDPATQAELDAVSEDLSTAGTINDAGNPVDWSKLKSVPDGFADGIDDDSGGDITGVSAGTGLSGGGSSGSVTLDVTPSYQLPQSCGADRVTQWTGSAWDCGGMLLIGTVAVDVGSVNAQACVTESVGITGAQPGDLGVLFPTLNFSNGSLTIYTHREVNDTGVIWYTVCNVSNSAIDPAQGQWGFFLVRQ